jgi:hypothetical protein
MNAFRRLIIRIYNEITDEPPPLPLLDRDTIDQMSVDEIAEYRKQIRAELEAERRRRAQIAAADLAAEERNMRRRGSAH